MSEEKKETDKPLSKPNICLGGRLNGWTFDLQTPTQKIAFRQVNYVRTEELDENGRRIWILETLQKKGGAA